MQELESEPTTEQGCVAADMRVEQLWGQLQTAQLCSSSCMGQQAVCKSSTPQRACCASPGA